MRESTSRVVIVFCALSLLSCAPSRAILTFEPAQPGSGAMILTDDELSRVLGIVSETARAFHFESAVWTAPTSGPAELLALHRRRDKETGYQRISIEVIRMKDTGQISIWVINRDGHSDETVTARVESALLEALAPALPSRRVAVERR